MKVKNFSDVQEGDKAYFSSDTDTLCGTVVNKGTFEYLNNNATSEEKILLTEYEERGDNEADKNDELVIIKDCTGEDRIYLYDDVATTAVYVPNPFTQLCVWPGTLLSTERTQEEAEKEFVEFFLENFKTRIQFEEQVFTNPDLKNGVPVPGTGGRSDLFFYIHQDDIVGFAVKRLVYGIRWWEDVIKYNSGNRHLYTEEFIEAHPVTW